MQFDYLVFIGRFEPFHNGHQAVIARALEMARKVIILVGSAEKPRTTRNPWNTAERAVMIQAAFEKQASRLLIRPLRDHLYNDALWVTDVQRIVAETIQSDGGGNSIGIIGHEKDASSYYLRMFPQWECVNSLNVEGVSATDLREYLFSGAMGDVGKDLLIKAAVPDVVFQMLRGFRDGPHFPQLLREYQHLKEYRKAWANVPFPPTFVTVDAMVVHSGHVLLVRRKTEPGKGLWAFPGGFVGSDETIDAAVIRELREETGLRILTDTLRLAIKHKQVFDHPERSLRGRTITHAYHFDFPGGDLPPVKGADDAQQARWVPISEALQMQPQFFEDHFPILEHFLR